MTIARPERAPKGARILQWLLIEMAVAAVAIVAVVVTTAAGVVEPVVVAAVAVSLAVRSSAASLLRA